MRAKSRSEMVERRVHVLEGSPKGNWLRVRGKRILDVAQFHFHLHAETEEVLSKKIRRVPQITGSRRNRRRQGHSFTGMALPLLVTSVANLGWTALACLEDK